jgi:hypothetical protein
MTLTADQQTALITSLRNRPEPPPRLRPLVYATQHALSQARAWAVPQLEIAVEDAIAHHGLAARDVRLRHHELRPPQRFVTLLDRQLGAIVVKVRRTPGGRTVWRCLHLYPLGGER